eukprot:TRINITY_DN44661_c0_g1_i2.p2 TRINITY_DN44661_c0_g1~~TRINITY_DN44661_c0_g1_i2.p2  ORF type:complete len:184 (-),score=51.47 TRINITY_DN44661_c0_g1_i2:165-716(-)
MLRSLVGSEMCIRDRWSEVVDVSRGAQPGIMTTLHGHGLLMLEARASKTWFGDGLSFLGEQQQRAVSEALSSATGKFSEVDSLIVASPVPVGFLSPASTKKMMGIVDDLKGLWGAYHRDLYNFVGDLLAWKRAKPGRELVVAGGDVHLGAHSDLFLDGKYFCGQLTTSAIHNERLGYLSLIHI